MRVSRVGAGRSLTLAAVALALAACSGDVANIAAPESALDLSNNSTSPHAVRLVKIGPAGTTATFAINATGGNLPLGATVTLNACDGSFCEQTVVWTPTTDDIVQVTIREVATTGGTVFDQIAVASDLDGFSGVFAPAEPVTTVRVSSAHSALVRFKNVAGAAPALRVVKTAGSATVTAGSPMTFNITVYSDGPGTATGVTLTDPLPGGDGIVWQTVSADCSISGAAPTQTLNCDFGDLAAGATRTVSVTAGTNAATAACGVYANTVTVNATNHAPVQSSASIDLTGCNTGVAGCTPGFWKQTQHFQFWTAPYTPGTLFGSVFANAFPGMTLLQVVSLEGGHLNALGRHTVAALLNAASPNVNYGMTPAEVIAAFNAAFSSGQYEGLKDTFDALNNRGCTAKVQTPS